MPDTPLWTPTPGQVARAQMTRFIEAARRDEPTAAGVSDYASLFDWSIREPAAFWAALWRFTGIVAEERSGREPWDEVVHGLLDLMYAKAPYTVLQRAMHIHPTVAEFIPTILGDLAPLPGPCGEQAGF